MCIIKCPLVIVDLKLSRPKEHLWKAPKNQIEKNHFEMDDPVLPSGTPLLESTLDKSLSTSQANLTRFLQTHLLRKWSLDACFSTSRSSSSTVQKIFRLFWPTFGGDKKICTSFLVGIYNRWCFSTFFLFSDFRSTRHWIWNSRARGCRQSLIANFVA